MIAKLICRLLGHKRRKRVPVTSPGVSAVLGEVLRCPRCGDEKKAKAISGVRASAPCISC